MQASYHREIEVLDIDGDRLTFRCTVGDYGVPALQIAVASGTHRHSFALDETELVEVRSIMGRIPGGSSSERKEKTFRSGDGSVLTMSNADHHGLEGATAGLGFNIESRGHSVYCFVASDVVWDVDRMLVEVFGSPDPLPAPRGPA